MDYLVKATSIRELIALIDINKIDLKPPYQRNFIWSPNDQKSLIDSILKKYPLPSFFLYQKPDGGYEMVDGQQRSRTIYRFWKGLIQSSDKRSISDIDEEILLNYKLNWSIISNLNSTDSLEDFYVLVNKSGKHLNTPELFKAGYHNTKFLALVEELLNLQTMIDLNLFTVANSKRMNDRSFIEELVAYLKVGITDKKLIIEKIYEIDVNDTDCDYLRNRFVNIIDKISLLNNYHAINKTRFKQKNDFYTLFNFVNENIKLDDDIFLYQYKILLLIAPFIKPSNDECEPLKDYALNCVSQSNSKNARNERLNFLNDVLKNQNKDGNDTLIAVQEFLEMKFGISNTELKLIEEFQLIDVESFSNPV